MRKGLLKIVIAIFLGVVGQLSLKAGMMQVGKISGFDTSKIVNTAINPWVIIGLVVYAFAMMVWLAVLAEQELSFAYPLLSTGYILIALFSWILFDEPVTLLRWFGIFTIVAGVYLVMAKDSEPPPPQKLSERLEEEAQDQKNGNCD